MRLMLSIENTEKPNEKKISFKIVQIKIMFNFNSGIMLTLLIIAVFG